VERAEQPSALVLRVMEVALGALEDAGFAPRRAIEAYCTLIGFTMGHVGYQLRGPLRPQRSRASGSRTAVVVADYPAAARTLIVRGWDIDAAFEFGLDTIVDGLKTRLRRGSAGQKRG
jgi:TetR/AcrR family transcriptional regulator, tetracycline repressor protein